MGRGDNERRKKGQRHELGVLHSVAVKHKELGFH